MSDRAPHTPHASRSGAGQAVDPASGSSDRGHLESSIGFGGPNGPSSQARTRQNPLGPALASHILEATGGRLSNIRWFRSDWQRGGGSTGFATFMAAPGERVEAVVKVPVGYTEWKWTTRLGDPARCPTGCECPTPRVLAHGVELNGYDLGWLVIEKFPGLPLAGKLNEATVRELIRTTARFHQRAAAEEPVTTAPDAPAWEKLLRKSRETLLHHAINEEQRWRHALRDLARVLDKLVARWRARPINTWCHGDLHPGNAMRRRPAPGGAPGSPGAGACVLIDLALVHPGHWIEDALYFERIYWGHESLLNDLCPVDVLAAERRALGLDVSGDWRLLADTRRILMAACAPAMVEREGNARYIHTALEKIERLLGRVAG